MSSSRASGQWFFSPALNARYRIDARRNIYVLEDGQELPIPATPRTTTGAPIPTQANQYVSPANTGNTAATPGLTAGAGELPTRLESLNLGAQETPNRQQRPRAGSAGGRRETASQPIIKAHDPDTQVSTVVQKAPAQVITDPTLYEVGVDAHRRLLPTTGDEERFDPNYRLRGSPKKFFIIGRVFLILWAEPAGESAVSSVQPPVLHIKGRYGQQVFSKVRRFVVIRENERSCSALPVLTYHGRGASQKNQREHGIIYTGKQAPTRPPYEQDLQPTAIRVDPDFPEDKLDPLSRINYGSVYTIEHNLKVKPFGMVNRDFFQPLLDQFGDVWISKVGLRTGQSQQVLRVTQELRPDLYARHLMARPAAGHLGTNVQPAARPGLTPIQEHAYERHGMMANAVQRNRPPNSSRDPGSTTSGEQRVQSGNVETVAPTASEEISPEVKKELRDMFERHRRKYIARGYSEEEARSAAEVHVRAEVDKIRFSRVRERSQASTSRSSADTRGSSGSLATPADPGSTSYYTLGISTRRSSLAQDYQAGAGTIRSALSQGQVLQDPIQATAGLPPGPARASSSQTPATRTTEDQEQRARDNAMIQRFVGEGWNLESANLIVRAMQRGYSADAARRIAAMVLRGATLPQAMAQLSEEAANASLHAPGRGKGRAPE